MRVSHPPNRSPTHSFFAYIVLCKKRPCSPSTAACLEVFKVLRCPRIMRFRLPQQRPICAKNLQFLTDIISYHQTLRTLESTAPATYFALAVVLYGGNIAKKRQCGLSPAGCLEVSKVLRWPRIIRFRLPRQTPICAKELEFFYGNRLLPSQPSNVLRLPRILHFATYITKAPRGKPKTTPVLLLLLLLLLLLSYSVSK